MFGSVSSPSHKVAGYSSPIVALRKHLDLYANVRPVSSVTGVPGPTVDMVIVRENTECLYIKKEEIADVDGGKKAIAYRQITSRAYEIALQRAAARQGATEGIWAGKQGKVTVVHKSNVLSVTDGLFRESVKKIGAEAKYADVKTEEQLVDSMVYRMFREPE